MSEMIVRGKAAAAAHFNITVRQLANWEKAGMPGRSGRDYDLVKIQLWRDHKQGRGGGSDGRQEFLSPQRGKDFEDARLKKGRADLVEMAVRRQRGELLPRADIEKGEISNILTMKAGLMMLPRSLPPLLINCVAEREMEGVIRKAVYDLLWLYAKGAPVPCSFTRDEVRAFVEKLLCEWEVKDANK